MDTFLKIFTLIWIIFLYALVVYRTFISKSDKRHTRENVGLILLVFILITISSNPLNEYLKIGCYLVGLILMIFTLRKRVRSHT
ncbi:Kef-type K+ transport system membrane component KefB [Paenibacillus qinlingensis]|uniref:Kef-type K+ transport system membrane component KefB n=1 Tax=Paenibacillus qinlingensis TaxID=1837343 RepID=A0ABU1P634_9BACL|nr:Kef-type K+ transport system membrane component KefB [Paenibacillus qinlingensis]